MDFFEHLKLELEDIQDELKFFTLSAPIQRIGDFGCGDGFSTLSLMLVLQATECIGVDKFNGNFSPSIRDTTQKITTFCSAVRNALSNTKEEDEVQKRFRLYFSKSGFPIFQRGDVVKGENLPNNLDFAYCKKLLGNILSGEYENSIHGEIGVQIAIDNITKTLRQGGMFCAVEKDVSYFAPFFERANLKLLRACHIQRGEIQTQGRSSSTAGIGQYIVYCYQKIKSN